VYGSGRTPVDYELVKELHREGRLIDGLRRGRDRASRGRKTKSVQEDATPTSEDGKGVLGGGLGIENGVVVACDPVRGPSEGSDRPRRTGGGARSGRFAGHARRA